MPAGFARAPKTICNPPIKVGNIIKMSSVAAVINSFGAKFQMTFVVCFLFKAMYCMERSLYVKLKDRMSNSVDPDETAH